MGGEEKEDNFGLRSWSATLARCNVSFSVSGFSEKASSSPRGHTHERTQTHTASPFKKKYTQGQSSLLIGSVVKRLWRNGTFCSANYFCGPL